MRLALVSCALGASLVAAMGCSSAGPGVAGPETTSATIAPILDGTPAVAYPEAALLEMQATSGQEYACSATLIAPRVVLTAGHCVDGMVAWQVTVGGVTTTSTSGETFDWHEGGATNVDPNHHDVGLVYLDRAIDLPSYPTIATAPVADGTQLLDLGRIDNGVLTNSLYAAPVGVVDGSGLGYPFDYAGVDVIEHGDSGGPVFVPSTHTIVAVNSGANTVEEVLARVDLVSDWIASRVAALSGGPSGSTADAGVGAPDVGGAAQDAGSPQAVPPPDAGSCSSGNDALDLAQPIASAGCGALASATDVGWYTVSAAPGLTTIALHAAGDAALTVGYLTPKKTCTVVIPSTAGAHGATIEVTGDASAPPVTICVSVASSSGSSQSYAVSVTR